MIRSITYDMDEGLTIEVDAGDQVRLIQHASAPDSVFYAVVAYPPRSEGQVEQPVLRSPTHRLLPDGSAIPVSGFGPEGEYVAYDPLDPTRWVRVGTVNEPYGPVEPQEGYVNRVQMVDLWWLLRRETRWWYGERSIPIPGSTALAAHPSTVLDTIRASLGAAMVSAFFPDPVGAKVSLRVEAPSVGGLLQFLTRWEAILLESGFVFNSVTEGGRPFTVEPSNSPDGFSIINGVVISVEARIGIVGDEKAALLNRARERIQAEIQRLTLDD